MRLLALMPVMTALLAAATPQQNQPPGETAPALRRLVAAGNLPGLRWPDFSDCRASVQEFYETAGYAPAWIRGGVMTSQAEAVIEILTDAGAKGLNADDYDGSRWAARIEKLRGGGRQALEADLARFDLALTVCLLRYISDLHFGKSNPGVFHSASGAARETYLVPVKVLERLMNAKDVHAALAGLEPPFPGYLRTQRALQTYLAMARDGDGQRLPLTEKPVEPGQSYPGAAALTRLLRRLGDLPAEARVPVGPVYQGALVEAVKRFQERHGLDPDGRIGKATQAQLKVPLSRRVRQLRLALERWRWVPHEFPRPPIVVNIPEFRLRAFNSVYRTELEMKAVVGRAYRRQTPVFAGEVTQVIFRPYWNVPWSIQRAELVPQLDRDRSYLARNGYEVVTPAYCVVRSGLVDDATLEQLRSGKLLIRQVPGRRNALGLVKFLFPNTHDVYLHGTPETRLFSKSRRDFSHGCIRVERPELLAAWVLRDKAEWTPQLIAEAMKGPGTREVNLTKPIPVLIVYATAVVPESGEVRFFDDIYGQDARLEEELAKSDPKCGPAGVAPGPHPRQ